MNVPFRAHANHMLLCCSSHVMHKHVQYIVPCIMSSFLVHRWVPKHIHPPIPIPIHLNLESLSSSARLFPPSAVGGSGVLSNCFGVGRHQPRLQTKNEQTSACTTSKANNNGIPKHKPNVWLKIPIEMIQNGWERYNYSYTFNHYTKET